MQICFHCLTDRNPTLTASPTALNQTLSVLPRIANRPFRELRPLGVSLRFLNLSLTLGKRGQDGALSDVADHLTVLLDGNEVVANDGGGLSVDNDGVDLEGVTLKDKGLSLEANLL